MDAVAGHIPGAISYGVLPTTARSLAMAPLTHCRPTTASITVAAWVYCGVSAAVIVAALRDRPDAELFRRVAVEWEPGPPVLSRHCIVRRAGPLLQ